MSSSAAPVDWGDRISECDSKTAHDPQRAYKEPRANLSMLAVMVFGICLSAVAFFVADEMTHNAKREGFERAAFQRIAEVKSQIVSSINSLYAIRGLFRASGDVDRRGFSKFVAAMQLGPGVQALEWAQSTLTFRWSEKRCPWE